MKRVVPSTSPDKICYVLKRFPRLSETFILNEIRALERLGTNLIIVSLLPPEEGIAHSTVAEVRGAIRYLPEKWLQMLSTAVGPHAGLAATSPLQYLKALGKATWLGVRHGHPLAALKNFVRAGLVANTCRRQHVRHIHAHFANTPTSVAHLASVLIRIPFSFTTHAKDLYLTSRNVTHERVAAAKFVLTCTQYNVDFLREFVALEHWPKLHLVYHGVDLSAFAAYLEQNSHAGGHREEGVPIVLSVGRLVPKKGMDTLIAACALLRDRGIVFECVIVGNGPLKSIMQEQINGLGLAKSVKLMGAMTHDKLISLYRQATVFALTPQITADGDRDGIPNVLVEAMAVGLAVVSTSVSGIPELVQDGQTGLLVPPNNPAAAAAALEKLLRDGAIRQHLSVAARKQLTARFECWESTKSIHTLLNKGAAA